MNSASFLLFRFLINWIKDMSEGLAQHAISEILKDSVAEVLRGDGWEEGMV